MDAKVRVYVDNKKFDWQSCLSHIAFTHQQKLVRRLPSVRVLLEALVKEVDKLGTPFLWVLQLWRRIPWYEEQGSHGVHGTQCWSGRRRQ